MTDDIANVLDHVSALIIGGALVGALPSISLALGCAWYLVRFYDRFVTKRK